MKRLESILILLFFIGALGHSSVFMLSIEEGKVYTEKFNLTHILKYNCCSSTTEDLDDDHRMSGSCHNFSHNHIQLTQYSIPEETFHPVSSPISLITYDADNLFVASYLCPPGAKNDSVTSQINISRILKFPDLVLEQGQVLLI